MTIRNKNDNNKKQKVNNDKEGVLFNTDTLSKITSYLPSSDLLNLGLTSKRFSAPFQSNNDKPSLIEESARIAVQDIATEEQLAVLPYYQGSSSLEVNHHLQLLRGPLTFDQLIGADYAENKDKSCVCFSPIRSIESYSRPSHPRYMEMDYLHGTAFSNNIVIGGKHYAIFEFRAHQDDYWWSRRDAYESYVGVMRPGEADQFARGNPIDKEFFQNFSRCVNYNNSVQCCMYDFDSGECISSDWTNETSSSFNTWEGSESISFDDEIGMLLDLDEGTLSMYKNGQRLGVMKRGLAGPYCWVVSMWGGEVTIKRGTIPPS